MAGSRDSQKSKVHTTISAIDGCYRRIWGREKMTMFHFPDEILMSECLVETCEKMGIPEPNIKTSGVKTFLYVPWEIRIRRNHVRKQDLYHLLSFHINYLGHNSCNYPSHGPSFVSTYFHLMEHFCGYDPQLMRAFASMYRVKYLDSVDFQTHLDKACNRSKGRSR